MVDEKELIVFVPEEAPAVLSGVQRKSISKVFAKAVSSRNILSKRNLIPMTMVFLLVLVKPFLRFMPDSYYLFLVYPTQLLVSLFSGLDFTSISASEYKDFALGIVIDRSCAGMTFLLISWVVCSVAVRRTPIRHQLQALPALFVAGFLVTICANVSRILCSIFAEKIAGTLFPGLPLHTAIGITVYLTFLLSFYTAISLYLNIREAANENLS